MQIEIFSKVKDPRVLGKVKHELEDVLRIALIGVLCASAVENIFNVAAPLISEYVTEEKGHGRKEKRKCSILDTKLLEKEGVYEEWPGLKHIIKMEREWVCDGTKSGETYYLSRETSEDASYYAGCIRAQWGIEKTILASRCDIQGR